MSKHKEVIEPAAAQMGRTDDQVVALSPDAAKAILNAILRDDKELLDRLAD